MIPREIEQAAEKINRLTQLAFDEYCKKQDAVSRERYEALQIAETYIFAAISRYESRSHQCREIANQPTPKN